MDGRQIPTHRLHVHVRRCVEAGYKVGVVRQIETRYIKMNSKSASKNFERKLMGVYTKATMMEEDLCGDDALASNAIASSTQAVMCVYERPKAEKAMTTKKRKSMTGKKRSFDISEEDEEEEEEGRGENGVDVTALTTIAIVCIVVGTSVVTVDEFDDDVIRSQLLTRLRHLAPAEIIVSTSFITSTTLKAIQRELPNAHLETMASTAFHIDAARTMITSVLSPSNLLNSIINHPCESVTICVGALMTYLNEFGIFFFLLLLLLMLLVYDS